MIQLFDYFNHSETPNIILCNPNGDELYSLTQFFYNDKITLRFNAISEFEFELPSTTNNGITTEAYYSYIQSKRLVFIQNIGYFIIYDIVEDTIGAYPTKKVMCRSIDGELISKKISAFSGTYKFYDPFHVIPNIIDTVMALIPSWSIGTIDPLIRDKYRTFEITDTSIYSFLMTDVEKSVQCVFEFDYINKRLSAYAPETATKNTDIFMSFDNLIEKIELKEISDEIVTALQVFGGNELSIRGVNPTGGNIIYDFSYFKTTDWMNQDLIDAITDWEDAVETAKPTYTTNLTNLKTRNTELLDLYANPSTGLNVLKSQLSVLEAEQQAAVVRVPPDPVDIAEIAQEIADKKDEIEAKEAEIVIKEAQIQTIKDTLTGITSSLSFENNFTESQIQELSLFIHENTFVNESIITTSLMTEVEKQEQAEELYEQGLDVLEKVGSPRYEFSVDSVNFVALKEFLQFTAQLELGAIVTIDKQGTLIETVLLEMNMSFRNPSDFNLVFSNRLRLDDGKFQYSDILGQAVSTGNTVTLSSLVWNDWASNYRDEVSTFITSSLNATTNNIVNSTNQELVINSYGLRGRKQIAPGVYDGKEMWLTNHVLAFTDDSWETSKLALGTIETDSGTFSGLVGDVIVGRILAGNSLIITNDDGVTTKTFTLDQNGAILTNADFTITSDYSRILLNPDDGIKIQKNSGVLPVTYLSNVTNTGTGVTSQTFSVTVSSNVARILVVGIGTNGADVTSITRNSQNFTKLTSIKRPTGNTAVSEIWYLVNPTSGTNNITINYSGSAFVEASVSEFYNVSQTSPFKNTVSVQGNSNNPTLTISAANTDDMIFDNLCHWTGVATVGTNQTTISQITSDGAWKLATSRTATPTDLTPTWAIDSSVDYAYCATVLTSNKDVSVLWQNQLSIDNSGNAVFSGSLSAASGTFSGDISGASGTFSGSLSATSGTIGGWTIASNGISDSFSNYIRSNGQIKLGALTIDGSSSSFSGSLSAATGSFSGQITANSGSIGGWTIDSEGLVDSYGNEIRTFSNGQIYLEIGGFRAWETGTGTAQLSLEGLTASFYVESSVNQATFDVLVENSNRLYIDYASISLDTQFLRFNPTTNLLISGEVGLTGTYSGMRFKHGILVDA